MTLSLITVNSFPVYFADFRSKFFVDAVVKT